MGFVSSTRTAENRTRWIEIFCKFICSAPTTFQGNGVGWLGGAMVLGKLPVPGRPI